MNDKDFQIFEYIIENCNIIQEYLENTPTQESFYQNRLVQDAVSKRVSDIGELVKRLSEEAKSLSTEIEKEKDVPELTNWKGLAGIRDFLVHDYNNVDFEILYNVVIKEIPQLKETSECFINLYSVEQERFDFSSTDSDDDTLDLTGGFSNLRR